MRHLDLFSGIGGFALAAQMVWGDDYENIAFCDNNEFCQEVLRKNFPGCTIWGDIRDVTADAHERNGGGQLQGCGRRCVGAELIHCDLITGGFPCQPFSCAGKRAGQEDDRYLWPEMLRVIREFRPRWVLGENVAGIIEMALGQVSSDLEAADYEVGSFVIPACAVNAPHRRDRVWIVAHSRRGQQSECGFADEMPSERDSEKRAANPISRPDSPAADGQEPRLEGRDAARDGCATGRIAEYAFPDWRCDWREVAFATCIHRVDDGLSRRLVRLPSGRTISRARWRTEALKAYGNAIVPQVAAEIMLAMRRIDVSR